MYRDLGACCALGGETGIGESAQASTGKSWKTSSPYLDLEVNPMLIFPYLITMQCVRSLGCDLLN